MSEISIEKWYTVDFSDTVHFYRSGAVVTTLLSPRRGVPRLDQPRLLVYVTFQRTQNYHPACCAGFSERTHQFKVEGICKKGSTAEWSYHEYRTTAALKNILLA